MTQKWKRKFAFWFLFSLICVVLSIWEFVQSSTFLAAGQSLRKLGCWMLVCASKPLRRKHGVSAPRGEVELKLSCGKQIHLSIELMHTNILIHALLFVCVMLVSLHKVCFKIFVLKLKSFKKKENIETATLSLFMRPLNTLLKVK